MVQPPHGTLNCCVADTGLHHSRHHRRLCGCGRRGRHRPARCARRSACGRSGGPQPTRASRRLLDGRLQRGARLGASQLRDGSWRHWCRVKARNGSDHCRGGRDERAVAICERVVSCRPRGGCGGQHAEDEQVLRRVRHEAAARGQVLLRVWLQATADRWNAGLTRASYRVGAKRSPQKRLFQPQT